MRFAIQALLFLLLLGGSLAVKAEGWLGQSQPVGMPPIEWCDCVWIQNGPSGEIYLPGGWRMGADAKTPEKMSAAVSGQVLCDGERLYGWNAERDEIRLLKAVKDGLVDDGAFCSLPSGRHVLFVVPASRTKGYASRLRMVVFDQSGRRVFGIAPDGRMSKTVLDCSGPDFAGEICCAGLHPETGDLLLGSRWPDCRLRRFRPGGKEVRNASWPMPVGAERFQDVGGKVWALRGGTAVEVSDAPGGFSEKSIGWCSDRVNGIARAAAGWWLATTQGAQFFADADPFRRPLRRIGGLPGVTAVAILGGRVLVACRNRLLSLWLDDHADEALSCDKMWLTRPEQWNGNCTGIEVRDGIFLLRDATDGTTWAFDPTITAHSQRKRRQFVTNTVVEVENPLEASENGWTIRYDAERRGLLKKSRSATNMPRETGLQLKGK